MNQQAIIHTVDDVMKTLGADRGRFVLLLSDAARYMTAAGRMLKSLYPSLFHVTCVAHLVHNCAERVRNNFSNIDSLVASIKAAVVKNKDRKEMFAEIGYPPSRSSPDEPRGSKQLFTTQRICLPFARSSIPSKEMGYW